MHAVPQSSRTPACSSWPSWDVRWDSWSEDCPCSTGRRALPRRGGRWVPWFWRSASSTRTAAGSMHPGGGAGSGAADWRFHRPCRGAAWLRSRARRQGGAGRTGQRRPCRDDAGRHLGGGNEGGLAEQEAFFFSAGPGEEERAPGPKPSGDVPPGAWCPGDSGSDHDSFESRACCAHRHTHADTARPSRPPSEAAHPPRSARQL